MTAASALRDITGRRFPWRGSPTAAHRGHRQHARAARGRPFLPPVPEGSTRVCSNDVCVDDRGAHVPRRRGAGSTSSSARDARAHLSAASRWPMRGGLFRRSPERAGSRRASARPRSAAGDARIPSGCRLARESSLRRGGAEWPIACRPGSRTSTSGTTASCCAPTWRTTRRCAAA